MGRGADRTDGVDAAMAEIVAGNDRELVAGGDVEEDVGERNLGWLRYATRRSSNLHRPASAAAW